VLAVFQELEVDEQLYANVLGESVLNDAVAIVLFDTISQFATKSFSGASIGLGVLEFFRIFLGSLLVGIVVALIAALLLKYTQLYRFPRTETVVVIAFVYSSYFMAEGLQLSGIVAILLFGITLAHYGDVNLSRESQTNTRVLFHILANISETLVFIFLGLALFAFDQEYKATLIGVSIPIILISRALNIFPLSLIINLTRSTVRHRISWQEQIVLWFSGLRGAIAFALSLQIPSKNAETLLTTTLMIVLFSVAVCGVLMVPLLKVLKIKTRTKETEKNKARLKDQRRFMRENKCVRFDAKIFKAFLLKSTKISSSTAICSATHRQQYTP